MAWSFVSILTSLTLTSASLFGKPPHEYLEGKIPRNNARYQTFEYALRLLEERNARTIVETGTARFGDREFVGDGGSTIIFAEWGKDHGAEFFSIDKSMENIIVSRRATERHVPNYQVYYIYSDSIAFLQGFNREIDFLYLDSFDYDPENPFPSQEHHLKEIVAAYPFLTEKSVVMIDDCKLPGGGKGGLAIRFLLSKGWRLLQNGYQVILIRY